MVNSRPACATRPCVRPCRKNTKKDFPDN
jgi:hypothetical protein